MKGLRFGTMHVAVIDIGKPGKNLGWAIAGDCASRGTDLDLCIEEVADRLAAGPVALGFEAPMYVPLRDSAASLTKARRGECQDGVNRPFSASAGSTVLVIATVVVSYTLQVLRMRAPLTCRASLDYRAFFAKPNGLLLFEAFVTNQKKKHDERHVEDAELAAAFLLEAIGSKIEIPSAVSEPKCLSLLGAMMLRTGWSDDISVLAQECLVVRP